MQGAVIEVRRSEVAAPGKGGTFTIDGSSFSVASDPESNDPDRLVWTCTVRA
jgi:hypothetical protein